MTFLAAIAGALGVVLFAFVFFTMGVIVGVRISAGQPPQVDQ